VLQWFDACAGGAPQATTARAADAQALRQLRRLGYARDPDAPWFQLNTRALDRLTEPGLPPGFRFLTAAQADPALVVAAHRAAWHPSAFSAGSLDDVRSTWPYRDDLAVFIEAPDGRLAASALVWYDDVTRTAELEPVGTDPGFRGRGLGRAVSLLGLRAARDAGAAEAMVSCRGDERYPVPRRLYRSAGFTELTRDLVFRKRVHW